MSTTALPLPLERCTDDPTQVAHATIWIKHTAPSKQQSVEPMQDDKIHGLSLRGLPARHVHACRMSRSDTANFDQAHLLTRRDQNISCAGRNAFNSTKSTGFVTTSKLQN